MNKISAEKLRTNSISWEEYAKKFSRSRLNKIEERSHEIGFLMMLKKRREELGLSQYDLEKLTGLSRRTIIQVEQGKRNTTLSTLFALSEPLKMRVRIEFDKTME
jgi:DNA-binding XRE family transcriptional regulator